MQQTYKIQQTSKRRQTYKIQKNMPRLRANILDSTNIKDKHKYTKYNKQIKDIKHPRFNKYTCTTNI